MSKDLNGSDIACLILIPCCLANTHYGRNAADGKGNGAAVARGPITVCKAVLVFIGKALLGFQGFVIQRNNGGSGNIYVGTFYVEDQIARTNDAVLQMISPSIVGSIICIHNKVHVVKNDFFINGAEVNAIDVITHKLLILCFTGKTHFAKCAEIKHRIEVCVGASCLNTVVMCFLENVTEGAVNIKGILLLYVVTEAEDGIGNIKCRRNHAEGGRTDRLCKNSL